jgi:hypothetical protein
MPPSPCGHFGQAGISGRKGPIRKFPNELTGIAQRPPMIISDASNMSAASRWLDR